MTQDLRQLIHQGKQAYERRNYGDALAAFREVLNENPNFADVRHLTGLCLSFLGHPEAALKEFDEAIRLNERYIEAHVNRALVLTELGRYDDAQRAFIHAGRFETETEGPFPALISAKLANAHMAVGDLYTEADAHAQAAEQYRTALTMRPRFHDIRNKLACALIEQGNLDAAEAELQTVLHGNPRFLSARLNLGLVHFRRGDPARAHKEWQACAAQQPDNPQVRAYLAMDERNSPVVKN
jgi:tetratricopeptide (TPR) repeat protein